MKARIFEVTTYPICGGIAVPVVINVCAGTVKQAVKQAAKKHLHFTIDGVKYINYDGVLYANGVVYN